VIPRLLALIALSLLLSGAGSPGGQFDLSVVVPFAFAEEDGAVHNDVHAADGLHDDHGSPDADEAHGDEAHHEEHPPELPSLIHLIWKSHFEKGDVPGWLALLYRFQDIVYALLVTLIIVLLVRAGTRRMEKIPGPLQNVVEMFIEGFTGFIEGVLGKADGRRYVPFLGTLFLYIWFMNLFGLVPLMRSPTANLSTTAALACCVFLYVQFTALRRLGFLKYMKHLAGDPEDMVGWLLVPLMFPLHVISEFAKPVSLSLRLFGNIFGEDILIGVFAGLGILILAFIHPSIPFGVPLHLPFIMLALLMSTIQALVFTLLSTIYIMQVLPHEEGGH
jgi:F-type H+-transporting ATPase subunit a